MMTFLVPREIGELKPTPCRAIWMIAIAACLLRLFFWAYTGRTWEDALITVLHPEIVGRGLDLTHYHPGYGPVHGFTSPASVLIPLMLDAFHPGWGLSLLKLVSALLAIPTVLLAAGIALHPIVRMNLWLVFVFCGYLTFEHHQIMWDMAGMETQFAVFVLFLTMYHDLTRRTLALGIAMTLCMYACPDYAMSLGLVAVYLLVVDSKLLCRGGVIAAGFYAPWIISTALYYGSSVPNAIVAKWYPLWTRTVKRGTLTWLDTVWARVNHYIFLPLGLSFAWHGTGFLKLFEHKRPGDRVGCEPLGLIGYYSRKPVLDYPGPASPEVGGLLREHPRERNLGDMLEHVRPVLREFEYKSLEANPRLRFLQTQCSIEKAFPSKRVLQVFGAHRTSICISIF